MPAGIIITELTAGLLMPNLCLFCNCATHSFSHRHRHWLACKKTKDEEEWGEERRERRHPEDLKMSVTKKGWNSPLKGLEVRIPPNGTTQQGKMVANRRLSAFRRHFIISTVNRATCIKTITTETKEERSILLVADNTEPIWQAHCV